MSALAGDLLPTTLRTLRVGFESTAIAVGLGIPAGAALGLGRFRGRGPLLAVANAGIRMPPVAVGMALWLLMYPTSVWGGGPLSGLDWLYTTSAVILAQSLLALPIVIALTAAATQRVPNDLLDQARAFGAGTFASALLALREARIGVLAAVTAALGTALVSFGAVTIVGSSLGDATLATAALVQWGAGGHDGQAAATGAVLIGMFLVIAALLTALQQERGPATVVVRPG